MTRFYKLSCLLFVLTIIYNRPGYAEAQELNFSKTTSFNLTDPEVNQSAGALLPKKEKRHFFGVGLQFPFQTITDNAPASLGINPGVAYWHERNNFRIGVSFTTGFELLFSKPKDPAGKDEGVAYSFALFLESYYLTSHKPTSFYIGGGVGLYAVFRNYVWGGPDPDDYFSTSRECFIFRTGLGAEFFRDRRYRLIAGLNIDLMIDLTTKPGFPAVSRFLFSIGPSIQFLF